jgi:hypothetical protein
MFDKPRADAAAGMPTLVIASERNEANRNLISAKCWIASLTARDDDRGRRRRHCQERELRSNPSLRRHCEERKRRSNPSGTLFGPAMDCFASLAMTGRPGFVIAMTMEG